MAYVVASIVGLHLVSLGCLLLLAKHSVMLVDEDGRPVRPSTGWSERVVPRRRARTWGRTRQY